jgi:hypothetical protein
MKHPDNNVCPQGDGSGTITSKREYMMLLRCRGLRVRVGMHSGLLAEEGLLVNTSDSRVHYIGAQHAQSVRVGL